MAAASPKIGTARLELNMSGLTPSAPGITAHANAKPPRVSNPFAFNFTSVSLVRPKSKARDVKCATDCRDMFARSAVRAEMPNSTSMGKASLQNGYG